MTKQANIEIYTWSYCPYCIKAKKLLNTKKVDFTEYMIDGDDKARNEMTIRTSGYSSLPQVFIDDQHVGGCDDIHALDAKGQLDGLLFPS